MPEPEKAHPRSIGKEWRPFVAGSPSGRPLASWVYITPRYPDGIGLENGRRLHMCIAVELRAVAKLAPGRSGGNPQRVRCTY